MPEFCIYPVKIGPGAAALSPVPGRSGNYEHDLSDLLHWSPDLVLTLTTQAELDRMGAGGLGADLEAAQIAWHHVPIEDFGVPAAEFLLAWYDVSREMAGVLGQGGRVLVHCFGGRGRSGMIVLRQMVMTGEDPAIALARLRRIRAGAVETNTQLEWATQVEPD